MPNERELQRARERRAEREAKEERERIARERALTAVGGQRFAGAEQVDLFEDAEEYRRPSVGRKALGWLLGILIVLLVIYALLVAFAPTPAARLAPTAGLKPATAQLTTTAPAGSLAIAPTGSTLATPVRADEPRFEMGSTVQLVVALRTLAKQPIDADQGPGATLTVAPEDAQALADFSARGLPTMPFPAAGQLTERQALAAMLATRSSAHAELLARSAFGSTDAFIADATSWLAEHGLTGTKVVDVTGESSTTTASDLARITSMAWQQVAVRAILGESMVDIGIPYRPGNLQAAQATPGTTRVAYGFDGAGRYHEAFVFGVDTEGQTSPFGGAVMGQPEEATTASLVQAAVAETRQLGAARQALVAAGEPLGRFTTPWGAETTVSPKQALVTPPWAWVEDASLTHRVLHAASREQEIGEVVLLVGDDEKRATLRTDGDLKGPDYWWRFSHPFDMAGAFFDWLDETGQRTTPVVSVPLQP